LQSSDKMTQPFDPNEVGVKNGNYFGFPNRLHQSSVVLLTVPWDVTTSYRPGTAKAPDAILEASPQLDFYDFYIPNASNLEIGTIPELKEIRFWNEQLRPKAEKIISALESGEKLTSTLQDYLQEINQRSNDLNQLIESTVIPYLIKNQTVGIVGGDHSSPYGLIKALERFYPSFGILHIDAHADLRKTYEGFLFSHASIMYNVVQLQSISSITQVAIRDVSPKEIEYAQQCQKITMFSDYDLKRRLFCGESWDHICDEIVDSLPENVYISFDIDGLSPEFCPNTGTPVPGGLSFDQAMFLLYRTLQKGKRLIGFDLCEVAPGPLNDWDTNVGARVLFKLCLLAERSKHKSL